LDRIHFLYLKLQNCRSYDFYESGCVCVFRCITEYRRTRRYLTIWEALDKAHRTAISWNPLTVLPEHRHIASLRNIVISKIIKF